MTVAAVLDLYCEYAKSRHTPTTFEERKRYFQLFAEKHVFRVLNDRIVLASTPSGNFTCPLGLANSGCRQRFTIECSVADGRITIDGGSMSNTTGDRIFFLGSNDTQTYRVTAMRQHKTVNPPGSMGR